MSRLKGGEGRSGVYVLKRGEGQSGVKVKEGKGQSGKCQG